MRRFVGIFATLVVWASSSGLAGALHHLEAEHELGGHHDESNCAVWSAIHAPVSQGNVAPVQIVLEQRTETTPPLIESICDQRTPLSISCRGPPVC